MDMGSDDNYDSPIESEDGVPARGDGPNPESSLSSFKSVSSTESASVVACEKQPSRMEESVETEGSCNKVGIEDASRLGAKSMSVSIDVSVDRKSRSASSSPATTPRSHTVVTWQTDTSYSQGKERLLSNEKTPKLENALENPNLDINQAAIEQHVKCTPSSRENGKDTNEIQDTKAQLSPKIGQDGVLIYKETVLITADCKTADPTPATGCISNDKNTKKPVYTGTSGKSTTFETETAFNTRGETNDVKTQDPSSVISPSEKRTGSTIYSVSMTNKRTITVSPNRESKEGGIVKVEHEMQQTFQETENEKAHRDGAGIEREKLECPDEVKSTRKYEKTEVKEAHIKHESKEGGIVKAEHEMQQTFQETENDTAHRDGAGIEREKLECPDEVESKRKYEKTEVEQAHIKQETGLTQQKHGEGGESFNDENQEPLCGRDLFRIICALEDELVNETVGQEEFGIETHSDLVYKQNIEICKEPNQEDLLLNDCRSTPPIAQKSEPVEEHVEETTSLDESKVEKDVPEVESEQTQEQVGDTRVFVESKAGSDVPKVEIIIQENRTTTSIETDSHLINTDTLTRILCSHEDVSVRKIGEIPECGIDSTSYSDLVFTNDAPKPLKTSLTAMTVSNPEITDLSKMFATAITNCQDDTPSCDQPQIPGTDLVELYLQFGLANKESEKAIEPTKPSYSKEAQVSQSTATSCETFYSYVSSEKYPWIVIKQISVKDTKTNDDSNPGQRFCASQNDISDLSVLLKTEESSITERKCSEFTPFKALSDPSINTQPARYSPVSTSHEQNTEQEIGVVPSPKEFLSGKRAKELLIYDVNNVDGICKNQEDDSKFSSCISSSVSSVANMAEEVPTETQFNAEIFPTKMVETNEFAAMGITSITTKTEGNDEYNLIHEEKLTSSSVELCSEQIQTTESEKISQLQADTTEDSTKLDDCVGVAPSLTSESRIGSVTEFKVFGTPVVSISTDIFNDGTDSEKRKSDNLALRSQDKRAAKQESGAVLHTKNTEDKSPNKFEFSHVDDRSEKWDSYGSYGDHRKKKSDSSQLVKLHYRGQIADFQLKRVAWSSDLNKDVIRKCRYKLRRLASNLKDISGDLEVKDIEILILKRYLEHEQLRMYLKDGYNRECSEIDEWNSIFLENETSIKEVQTHTSYGEDEPSPGAQEAGSSKSSGMELNVVLRGLCDSVIEKAETESDWRLFNHDWRSKELTDYYIKTHNDLPRGTIEKVCTESEMLYDRYKQKTERKFLKEKQVEKISSLNEYVALEKVSTEGVIRLERYKEKEDGKVGNDNPDEEIPSPSLDESSIKYISTLQKQCIDESAIHPKLDEESFSLVDGKDLDGDSWNTTGPVSTMVDSDQSKRTGNDKQVRSVNVDMKLNVAGATSHDTTSMPINNIKGLESGSEILVKKKASGRNKPAVKPPGYVSEVNSDGQSVFTENYEGVTYVKFIDMTLSSAEEFDDAVSEKEPHRVRPKSKVKEKRKVKDMKSNSTDACEDLYSRNILHKVEHRPTLTQEKCKSKSKTTDRIYTEIQQQYIQPKSTVTDGESGRSNGYVRDVTNPISGENTQRYDSTKARETSTEAIQPRLSTSYSRKMNKSDFIGTTAIVTWDVSQYMDLKYEKPQVEIGGRGIECSTDLLYSTDLHPQPNNNEERDTISIKETQKPRLLPSVDRISPTKSYQNTECFSSKTGQELSSQAVEPNNSVTLNQSTDYHYTEIGNNGLETPDNISKSTNITENKEDSGMATFGLDSCDTNGGKIDIADSRSYLKAENMFIKSEEPNPGDHESMRVAADEVSEDGFCSRYITEKYASISMSNETNIDRQLPKSDGHDLQGNDLHRTSSTKPPEAEISNGYSIPVRITSEDGGTYMLYENALVNEDDSLDVNCTGAIISIHSLRTGQTVHSLNGRQNDANTLCVPIQPNVEVIYSTCRNEDASHAEEEASTISKERTNNTDWFSTEQIYSRNTVADVTTNASHEDSGDSFTKFIKTGIKSQQLSSDISTTKRLLPSTEGMDLYPGYHTDQDKDFSVVNEANNEKPYITTLGHDSTKAGEFTTTKDEEVGQGKPHTSTELDCPEPENYLDYTGGDTTRKRLIPKITGQESALSDHTSKRERIGTGENRVDYESREGNMEPETWTNPNDDLFPGYIPGLTENASGKERLQPKITIPDSPGVRQSNDAHSFCTKDAARDDVENNAPGIQTDKEDTYLTYENPVLIGDASPNRPCQICEEVVNSPGQYGTDMNKEDIYLEYINGETEEPTDAAETRDQLYFFCDVSSSIWSNSQLDERRHGDATNEKNEKGSEDLHKVKTYKKKMRKRLFPRFHCVPCPGGEYIRFMERGKQKWKALDFKLSQSNTTLNMEDTNREDPIENEVINTVNQILTGHYIPSIDEIKDQTGLSYDDVHEIIHTRSRIKCSLCRRQKS